MFKQSIRIVSGLFAWSLAGAVVAEDAHVNSMSYSTQAVYGYDVVGVYSSDGLEWDTLDGPPIRFSASMAVDTRWPGYVQAMGVFNGYCVDSGCASNPLIATEYNVLERDMNWNRVFDIAMEDIPVSDAGGIATIPLGDDILDTCNDHLTANGATSLYTFNHDVPTSFSVNTAKGIRIPPAEVLDPETEPDFNGGDETRQASFSVQVRCNPYVQDAFFVPAPVEDVELFLATFSNALTHPDAFRTCQQGRILARVTTEYAGPVAVHLWTELDGVVEDEIIQTWSTDIGSGVYEAEVERWVSVSEAIELNAMAVVDYAGPAGWSSGWKSLMLDCDTGVGDFTGSRGPIGLP